MHSSLRQELKKKIDNIGGLLIPLKLIYRAHYKLMIHFITHRLKNTARTKTI